MIAQVLDTNGARKDFHNSLIRGHETALGITLCSADFQKGGLDNDWTAVPEAWQADIIRLPARAYLMCVYVWTEAKVITA